MSLKETFTLIQKKCFKQVPVQEVNNMQLMQGKFVQICWLDDCWDVWILNNRDRMPLGELKLTNILATVPFDNITRLDGEAFFQTKDTQRLLTWVNENIKMLGLYRKKVPPSEAQLAQLRKVAFKPITQFSDQHEGGL